MRRGLLIIFFSITIILTAGIFFMDRNYSGETEISLGLKNNQIVDMNSKSNDGFNNSTIAENNEPLLSIFPAKILPGDPVFITINSASTPKSLIVGSKSVDVFLFDNKFRGLIPIDFTDQKTDYPIKLVMNDNSIATDTLLITKREVREEPLGIPDKLGGNTKEAEQALISNLSKEGAIISNVKSTSTILWSKPFIYPVKSPQITDDYGYDRKTVDSTIVHKGTDFRAPIGTEVFAMNDGVVKVAQKFIVYGNTVIVDHGLGLQTLYLHLSKINVKPGDIVSSGQIIGLSGDTGYAEAPHLHISVKIKGISIDPMTFLSFFKPL
jgi:murein DD-endopeptidase MepM/ murein hydrolase activator NlpD